VLAEPRCASLFASVSTFVSVAVSVSTWVSASIPAFVPESEAAPRAAAEAGVRVGNGKTAAAAGGGAMGATGGWNDGISSLWFHLYPHWKRSVYIPTRVVFGKECGSD